MDLDDITKLILAMRWQAPPEAEIEDAIRLAIDQAESGPDREAAAQELLQAADACLYAGGYCGWERGWDSAYRRFVRAAREMRAPARPKAPAPTFTPGSRQRTLDRWATQQPQAPQEADDWDADL